MTIIRWLDQATFDAYEKDLEPNARFVDFRLIDAGVKNLMFKDVALCVSRMPE